MLGMLIAGSYKGSILLLSGASPKQTIKSVQIRYLSIFPLEPNNTGKHVTQYLKKLAIDQGEL